MNYATLASNVKKEILRLWMVFALISGLYAAFIYLEFPKFIQVYTSSPPGFFILYFALVIMVLITFSAIVYAYGYKKGLRLGRDVTQS